MNGCLKVGRAERRLNVVFWVGLRTAREWVRHSSGAAASRKQREMGGQFPWRHP